jgi:hypothetical protein
MVHLGDNLAIGSNIEQFTKRSAPRLKGIIWFQRLERRFAGHLLISPEP